MRDVISKSKVKSYREKHLILNSGFHMACMGQYIIYTKKGGKEGRKEARKKGRKERRKKGRKEGMHICTTEEKYLQTHIQ